MNKIKLSKDIEYYRRLKESLVNRIGSLKLSFEQRRINYLEYKTELNRLLKDRSVDFWLSYYDRNIRNLERELKENEFEIRVIKNRRILLLIIMFLVISIPILFLLKDAYTGYVVYKIDKENVFIKSGLENIQANEKHGIIKFDHTLSEDEKEELEKEGINLLSYIPEDSWIVSTDTKTKKYKISKDNKIGFKNLIKNDDDSINLTVVFFDDVENDINLLERYGVDLISEVDSINGLIVNVLVENLDELLDDDNIQWIEPQLPEPIEFNDGSRVSLGVDNVHVNYNLSGFSVNIGEWDSGHADNSHYDLIDRIIYGDSANVQYHSTHVAGIAIGNGNRSLVNNGSSGQWKGMAPNARIISYEWFNDDAELEQEYINAINNYGLDISTNSWGLNVGGYYPCEYMGNYTTANIILDKIVNGDFGLDKRVLIIWAAGNDRGRGLCGSNISNPGANYMNIPPYGTGKNILTIGAINSDDDTMTGYSSWGPTDDGRIKPELVAPGDEVLSDGGIKSTIPGNRYTVYTGTSMSAPAVAGVAALIIENFVKNYNYKPWPSTVKAILIQTATDLGNRGPDYSYGYGKINATAAIDLGNEFVINDTIVNNSKKYNINIQNETQLKLTLVWDDIAPTINAIKQLVNDLDLVVISPNSTRYYPFTLNKDNPPGFAMTNKEDDINVIEQVVVKNPESGLWRIIVNNTGIITQQDFSLVSNIKLDKVISVSSPVTTLESPSNGLITNDTNILFNCSAIDNIELSNISLYSGREDNFSLIKINEISGIQNSTIFNINLTDGRVIWNCLTYNNNSLYDWGNENYSLIVDTVPPSLSSIKPEDNVTFTTNSVLFSYDVNDVSNVTCNFNLNGNVEEINLTITKTLENNNYTWFIDCMDQAGNINNSETRNFVINYIQPSPPSSGGSSGGGGSGGGGSGRRSKSSSSTENIIENIQEKKEVPEKTEKPIKVLEEQKPIEQITKPIEVKEKKQFKIYYYFVLVFVLYILFNVIKVRRMKYQIKKKRFIRL